MGTDMRVWAAAALVAASVLLSGCFTVEHNTASKKPEVTIAAPADRIKPAMINAFINEGYAVRDSSEYAIVLGKNSIDDKDAIWIGSGSLIQVTLNFATIDKSTRVVADIAWVMNPGSGKQETMSGNNLEMSTGIQATLDRVKASLSSS